eukprot:TRINITY_DN2912_c0_g1_i1.p3 TRINITY_DN2912_c0_g1~~TRINITY_DN2912_c0_g1_i1.p3  ORF type:complete len:232 (-),score=10.45 TRINITY_DN2912_c0_g1_i1:636-1331(-)
MVHLLFWLGGRTRAPQRTGNSLAATTLCHRRGHFPDGAARFASYCRHRGSFDKCLFTVSGGSSCCCTGLPDGPRSGWCGGLELDVVRTSYCECYGLDHTPTPASSTEMHAAVRSPSGGAGWGHYIDGSSVLLDAPGECAYEGVAGSDAARILLIPPTEATATDIVSGTALVEVPVEVPVRTRGLQTLLATRPSITPRQASVCEEFCERLGSGLRALPDGIDRICGECGRWT